MDIQIFKSFVDYNEVTGEFIYKKNRGRMKKGQRAGGLNLNGYWQIVFNNKSYLAHRVAWLYVYGFWPKNQIDHIDGNKTNNSILNLRDCIQEENMQNIKEAQRNNKSGILGVGYKKSSNRYVARINVNKIDIYLGCFKNANDARNAYLLAKEKYHPFRR